MARVHSGLTEHVMSEVVDFGGEHTDEEGDGRATENEEASGLVDFEEDNREPGGVGDSFAAEDNLPESGGDDDDVDNNNNDEDDEGPPAPPPPPDSEDDEEVNNNRDVVAGNVVDAEDQQPEPPESADPVDMLLPLTTPNGTAHSPASPHREDFEAAALESAARAAVQAKLEAAEKEAAWQRQRQEELQRQLREEGERLKLEHAAADEARRRENEARAKADAEKVRGCAVSCFCGAD